MYVKKNLEKRLIFGEIMGMEGKDSTNFEKTVSEIFLGKTISNFYIYP